MAPDHSGHPHGHVVGVHADNYRTSAPDPAFLNESTNDYSSVNCGTDAKRFLAIYAIPSGNSYNSSAISHIRQDINTMDEALDAEAGRTFDQHFRFACTNGVVDVQTVYLQTSSNTSNDIVSELNNTYNSNDRKYLAWVEVTNETIYCGSTGAGGCAHGRNEDETASTSNINNNGVNDTPTDSIKVDIATIAYKGSATTWGSAMHEAFHLMGAVQANAPFEDDDPAFPDNTAHVYEGMDIVANSNRMINCSRETLDCNKNDYYSAYCAYYPASCTSWLKDKYNIAKHSLFLTTVWSETGSPFKCDGVDVTYTGTTEMPDQIFLGSTNDVVDGREGWNNPADNVIQEILDVDGGNDRVCGDGGRDEIRGGSGDDRLWGEHGRDVVKGYTGNDTVNGGPADDVLYDGMGTDLVSGGAGQDTLYQCADNVADDIHGDVDVIIGPSSTYC
jgi:hypothetical protein